MIIGRSMTSRVAIAGALVVSACSCVTGVSISGQYSWWSGYDALRLNSDSTFEYVIGLPGTREYSGGSYSRVGPKEFVLASGFDDLEQLPVAIRREPIGADVDSDSVSLYFVPASAVDSTIRSQLLLSIATRNSDIVTRSVRLGEQIRFSRVDQLIVDRVEIDWVPGSMSPFPQRSSVVTGPFTVQLQDANLVRVELLFPVPGVFYYKPIVAETLRVIRGGLQWGDRRYAKSKIDDLVFPVQY